MIDLPDTEGQDKVSIPFKPALKVINEPLTSTAASLFKGLCSGLGLVLLTLCFKMAFWKDQQGEANFRVWEDLHGRGMFFFVTSGFAYIRCANRNLNISFFELYSQKRWLFAIRLVTGACVYVCMAVSLSQNQKASFPTLTMLALSIPVVRTY